MKVFIRTRRLLHLATFVLLAALIAVWLSGLGGHALAASTWTSQTSPTIQNLNGIACPGTTTCFAVGASGTILKTTNGGSGGSTPWAQLTSGTSQNLNGIACLST